jgi:hypothetical protein
MARHDWVALICLGRQEYLAQTELLRFGLNVYLPQHRRCARLRDGRMGPPRCFPLFPGYLLLPFADVGDRAILRNCRGLRHDKPVLCSAEGVLWRAPERSIMALREAEFSGQFDRENPKIGEDVQIKRSNLEITGAVIGNLDARFLTLMTPLFGGARAKVDRGSVTAVA